MNIEALMADYAAHVAADPDGFVLYVLVGAICIAAAIVVLGDPS